MPSVINELSKAVPREFPVRHIQPADTQPELPLEIPPLPVREEPAVVDHSRRHVQRSLHHLVRLARQEIKQAIRSNGEIAPETAGAIGDLVKEFRDELKDAFHAAGRGNDFDRSLILPGISAAVVGLTEGLRALRESLQFDEEPSSEDRIIEVPSLVELEQTPDDEDPTPGGLLSVQA